MLWRSKVERCACNNIYFSADSFYLLSLLVYLQQIYSQAKIKNLDISG